VGDVSVRVVRKPIRTLRLTVRSPDGPVRVSAPLRTSDAAVHRFVSQHRAWIRRQQARLAALPPVPPPPTEAERRQLAARLPALLARWEPVIGVRVSAFRVRHMRTRWGSCNIHERRISLSTSLARRPDGCLEYVLVHELVHLLERRHNARFYGLLDRFLPDWRDRRAELRGQPLPVPADPALDSAP
jgi:hypothetical protein